MLLRPFPWDDLPALCDSFRCGHSAEWAARGKPFAMPGVDKPHYPPDRLCDVRHIKLEVALDFKRKRITGVASHTLAAVNDGLAALDLDSIDLDIKAVRLGGKPLAFDVRQDKLHVELGRPCKAGEEFVLAVQYEGSPRRGLYFNAPDKHYPRRPLQAWTQGEDMDSRFWYPCFDFPNQKATSEVIATVPEPFVVLSNGHLVKTTKNARGKTRTYHWLQDKPHANYLITLVAGDYAQVKGKAGSVPLDYYVPKGSEKDVERVFGRTPEMVRFFASKIGVPYAWDKYAQVVVADFIFGGMENTSATTLTDTALFDERAGLDYDVDGLIAHELAHQWWGDLLTCHSWSHAWLNEGFATYFDALFKEHHRGVDEFRYQMLGNARGYMMEDAGRYRRPIVTNVYAEPIDIFDRHLYEKGSLVLHMLRFVLGDDLFWKALGHYGRAFRGKTVVTKDLERSIEQATGRDLSWFFDEWVYKGGHPNFKLAYAWDDATKTASLSVSQTQEVDSLTSLFRMPVDVAFTTSQGERVTRVQIEQKEHTFSFPLPEKPLMVRFDPGNWVLKTVDFSPPKEMLLHQLKNDGDVTGRIAAAQALAKLGGQDVITALKEAVVKDGFWGVQAEAARALGQMKSDAAMQALIEALPKVAHPKARRGVVGALGEYKDEAAASALLPFAGRDKSYFVEAEAARALGRTRDKRAYEALEKAMSRDSYAEVVRAGACDGLAELRDEKAIPLLTEWTRQGKPQQARGPAIMALGKLGEGKREVLEHLTELVNDHWLRVRLSTIEALAVLKDVKAIPALDAQVARDLDGRVKRAGREAMARIREGKDRTDDVKKLRDDFDKLMEDNKKLRDRLDKLEAKPAAEMPKPAEQPARKPKKATEQKS